MRYMVSLPLFHDHANPRKVAQLALEAEESEWDGFFVWDTILFKAKGLPVGDPWVSLAAIAMNTERIRIGTMVTPLPRRRTWQVAREAVAVDQLSNGRLTLAVGLGEPALEDFEYFGEETDLKVRARMLDEALEVMVGLWSGKPFSYSGKYHKILEMTFLPTPVQQPRIPIWVGGYWPKKGPVRRAARWDGANFLVPMGEEVDYETAVKGMAEAIKQYRSADEPYDLVAGGYTPGDNPAVFERVGATWWLESLDPWRFGWDGENQYPAEAIQERVRQGPPK
jgi:alkanesulfonate monooxygenase SsuD/methylene tetrahydromethanopterin reductase-like flavin-dependent oxidoreductase (luciferase family)